MLEFFFFFFFFYNLLCLRQAAFCAAHGRFAPAMAGVVVPTLAGPAACSHGLRLSCGWPTSHYIRLQEEFAFRPSARRLQAGAWAAGRWAASLRASPGDGGRSQHGARRRAGRPPLGQPDPSLRIRGVQYACADYSASSWAGATASGVSFFFFSFLGMSRVKFPTTTPRRTGLHGDAQGRGRSMEASYAINHEGRALHPAHLIERVYNNAAHCTPRLGLIDHGRVGGLPFEAPSGLGVGDAERTGGFAPPPRPISGLDRAS